MIGWVALLLFFPGQVKAYTTRVGEGPFPTEILGKGGDLLRTAGMEFGTTTGRPRRCGWLDVVALKYCCQINGFSSLNLTKLDVLSDLQEVKLGVSYHLIDGKRIESFPSDLQTLEQLQASLLFFLMLRLYSRLLDDSLRNIGQLRDLNWLAFDPLGGGNL